MRTSTVSALLLAIALLQVACGDNTVVPRQSYNRGLRLLAAGDLEPARDKLLAARDEAGADDELRFRAAAALGHTLARQADAVEVAEPEQALSLLRQSAGWFQDAARQHPEDDEPRKNLEKVLRRIQVLADKLNEGGGLEARLERIIDDQRALRDSTRVLLSRLDADKVKDPVGFRTEFSASATQQRALMADVGTLIDSASDERELIEQKPEEQRSDMDKVRTVQLQAATHYLERARAEQADCRREMRRLDANAALSSAAGSLAELKRAREQLLDPITVLKTIASEEIQLTAQTELLAMSRKPKLSVDEPAAHELPVWLNDATLAEQQASLAERTAELGARLGSARAPEGKELDPKQRRMLEAAVAAAPLVSSAEAKMREAIDKLGVSATGDAAERQEQASTLLLEAAELFADIRPLIELAYHGQKQTVALITPPEADATSTMTTHERISQAGQLVAKTSARLSRLDALLADELQLLDAQKAQGQGQGQGQAQEQDPTAAERQRIEAAQNLRGLAAKSLERLSSSLATKDPAALQHATEALQHIEALRRLYYSLVEHLKELRAMQAETGDRTADAESKDDEAKAELLGPLVQRQSEHLAFGDELSKALAAQADAAASSGDQQAAEQADRLGRAAEEVGKALVAMQDAVGDLGRAQQDAASMSVTLEGALKAQPEALEHLDEAIRILEPPQDQQKQQQDQQEQQDQQNQQDQQDQQEQQKQQQEQQAQEAPQELSQQEAQRRLEAIREREAERQRHKQQQAPEAPVEKDW